MTNRANAAFAEDSVPSYYRINAFFPFVDHCLSELNERFPEQTRPSFLAFQLLPSRVQNISAEHIEDIHTRYEDDLPDSSYRRNGKMEMFCAGLQKQDSNQSLKEAIELAVPNYCRYPNLHAVFRVLLTMPVGSVPCERSFSAMRRLKHWSRSTMTEDRLAGLASLFIHRDIYLCRENIMRKFDEAKKRRLGPLHF